jgi:putative Mn2+ efflux pump MntP
MNVVKICLTTALFFGLVVVIPFGIVWSLNTLFYTEIPYTWQTWAATVILSSVVYGSSAASNYSKKKKQRTSWGYYA